MRELEEELDEYINQNVYNCAFLLKGQWGSGKTYFINNIYSENHNDKEFIYVSLNGIETLEDIDIKLTETLIKDHLGKGKLKSLSLRKILSKDIFKLVNYKNIIGILNKEYKKVLIDAILDTITNFLSKDKVVLVFDDIERCKVEAEKLLAYLNNYIEHQKIKTILIADEQHIKDNEYGKIKEKVIGNSVEYIPNIVNNIKFLFNKTKINEEITDIINRNLEKFNNELASQKFFNMRTVQFIIDRFMNFYNKILKNSEYTGNIELEDRIFNYLMHTSIIYKKGEKLYQWKEAKYGYINNEDEYSYENYRYGFKFIDDYIVNGILDKEEILYVLHDYNNHNLPKKDPYNQLKNRYWELQDNEVYKLVDEIFENLKQKKYEIEMISPILALILKLEEFGYKIRIEDFKKEFKNFICEKQKEDSILYLNTDIELINMESSTRKRYIEEFEMLKKYSLMLKWDYINNIVKSGQFDILFEEFSSIKNQSLFIDNGFFSNINLDELVKEIKVQNKVIQIWDFKYFCDSLIKNYQINEMMKKDMKDIKYLLDKLQNLDLNDYDIGKKRAIQCIIDDLKKMITRIK